MSVRLSRVDPSQNMARFYEIDLQPTLFGEFSVQRNWGRIGTTGQSKSYWFPTEEIAVHQASLVEAAKRRRGYRECSFQQAAGVPIYNSADLSD